VVTAGCGGDSSSLTAAEPTTGTGTTSTTATSSATATSATVPEASAKTVAARPGNGDSQWAKGLSTKNTITVSDTTLVARAKTASVKVFDSPTSSSPVGTLKNPLPSGGPLVLFVQEQRSGRIRVLLPVRPNESQGWVSASDVTLSQHHYRIVVSTGKHTLTVYSSGSVAMQVPVGLGTGGTPTPGGVFYIKELLRPSDPNGAYGPYAFGLSGYSPVLTDFGGGDGAIGIHGTNEPDSLGSNVSHGCIRMSNANITKMAKMLPLGVPVQITS
jgi:lipoprotein-anchoring transpeptidase ErfK/SrfK